MNPQSSEAPGLNLPPVHEPAASVGAEAEPRPSAPEQVPAAPEQAPMHGQPVSTALPVVPPPLTPPVPTAVATDDVAATTNQPAAVAKDDTDLIEKEWVNKAKAIIERTREDPYTQTEELTEVKADYLQKRYGKTVKVSK